jgi:hypothetical protein
MQETSPSSLGEVIRTWLDSEWHGLPCGMPSGRDIIDNANLGDAAENARRKWLLRHRAIILDEIPPGAPTYYALVEEIDLPELYIIPTADWYLDTGRSFRLVDTPANLRPGRVPIDHYTKVRAKSKYMCTHGTASNEVLILMAPSAAGPYTIIDGTHRAAALYADHAGKPNMPWKGILIRDPLIEQSMWSINSKVAQSSIPQMAAAAAAGILR